MFGRLLRVTGTVLVIALAFATPVLVTSAPATAAGAPGSWQTEQTYTSGIGYLSAISCASAADCIAIGNSPASIVSTTDGGTTWTAQSVPRDVLGLNGISCPSASDCTAVGYGAEALTISTTNGGATWTESDLSFHALEGVSCPSVTDCTAVGFSISGLAQIVDTFDGGANWTAQVAPSGMGQLLGVSCPSTSNCTAVGTPMTGGPEIATTTDGGATWNAQSVPSGAAQGMNGISCPSVSDCTAAGGVLIATTDGGTTWNIQTTPANHGVQAVSCPSTSDCTAVGVTGTSAPFVGDIQATTNGGATWTTESAPSGVEGLVGVSCPAAGACTAVGQDSSGDPVIIGQGPTTFVGIPSAGATISGASWLDAGASSPVGIASVNFEVSGGSINDQVVSGSTPTLYGYIGAWNSTTVPNGTYTLQSVATDVDGVSTTSAPITITVNNPPPSTFVSVPSNGSTQSGTTAVLDGGATADVTSVSYELSGGTLTNQVIATATPTIFGWLAVWDTTSVPNGTYTLQSVGTYSGGTVTSAPITITVSN